MNPQPDIAASDTRVMKSMAFWPSRPPAPLKVEWERMTTRQIVPIARDGWANYSISEWELNAASWQDFHPHSEYNLVLEGELFVAAGGDVQVIGPGDVARVPAGRMGRYWSPGHTRMIGVYGPNPEGVNSSGFAYWPLDTGPSEHPNDPSAEDPLEHIPGFNGIDIWRDGPTLPERPEWIGNRGRFITDSPQSGSWTEPILSAWELDRAAWTDRHQHTEFNFLVDGELEVECSGEILVLRAGDSVEIAAGEVATYRAREYARMVAVYGPNPLGLASSDFRYESI